ncbi:purine permease 21-like [Chenopodium quinoa]|uniref:Probable purine permease n=1 Tax=Chenopodium quinoa TaxID=63459 RepID=A0A803MDP2_CHEQI|nr:purine permease 21-like [Chenopodium quinoa]
MASKLSTCFLSHGLNGVNSKQFNVRLLDLTRRHQCFNPASSKPNFRLQVNKISPLVPRIFANQQTSGEADLEFENPSNDGVSSLIIPQNDVYVSNNKPGIVPRSEDTTSSSSSSQQPGLKWWIVIVFYIVCVLLGQSAGMILGRFYYNEGGKSQWMATLVQYAGFPLLLPLYRIFPKKSIQSHKPINELSPLKTASIYLFFGLFVAAVGMMYAIGLQYVPVSTFSLLCASQLAFNALFSFFINSQKFTPYIINSLVLLTISSVLLVIQSGSSVPEGVSKANYVFGFICAIAYPMAYGLLLSLTEFTFQKVFKNDSFEATLDLLLRQSFIASCIAVVGILATGDLKSVKLEMDQFRFGKLSYVMTLICTALSWQVYNIGLFGLIVRVSSLFSNVVSTLGLPIVPVLAVIFFSDIMDGIKVVAMLLAIWGFISYAYDQYLDECSKTRKVDPTPSYATGALEYKN